jgi:transcriptional accessory protein Tex/SPT6
MCRDKGEGLMVRALLGSVVLVLCVGFLSAEDTKKDKTGKYTKAKITKVDTKNKTVTVQMKNKDGKSVQKKFNLTEEVRMLDSNGRIVAIDVFQSDDDVLILEADGKLKEIKKPKKSVSDKSKSK